MARVVGQFAAICVCILALDASPARAGYLIVDFTSPGLNSLLRDYKDSWAVGNTVTADDLYHAAAWDVAHGGGYIPLVPPGFDQSSINGTGGGLFAGLGFTFVGGYRAQAMLWSATTHNVVVMHPTGANSSGMNDTNGFHHGGWAWFGGVNHPLLWTNGPDDYVDLLPPGYDSGVVQGIDGTHQVGYATQAGPFYAMLWNGAAASAINLNPAGYMFSTAYGVFGNQQVGQANNRAAMWTGSAASFVDLTPPGRLSASSAQATNGQFQVGYAWVPGANFPNHAYRWSGTAESALDLHQFLPAGFDSSEAIAIDLSGNIYGSARDALGNFHTIEWMVVPEPSTLALVAYGGIGLLIAARRQRAARFRYLVSFAAAGGAATAGA